MNKKNLGFASKLVHSGDIHEKFGSDGEQIKELDPKYEYGPRLKLPNGMHFNNTHLTNNRKNSKK